MATTGSVTNSDEVPSIGIADAVGDANSNGVNSSVTDAAVKVQKVYRSYRTRRTLADTAVATDDLWWQALEHAKLKQNTMSFFKSSEPESPTSRWNRIASHASKVGKGSSQDDNAQKLAFLHWIEAIDPRHRHGLYLKYYYNEWCRTESGQPFFYWLDIGDGKDLDLEECPRSKLRQHCVKYLGPRERERYEYEIVDGKIIHKLTGTPLTTKEDAVSIFVMSPSKKLYVGEKQRGVFQHSSFLAGGAIIAAGILEADNGVLKSVCPSSGHYRPSEEVVEYLFSIIKEYGVNLDQVKVKPLVIPNIGSLKPNA